MYIPVGYAQVNLRFNGTSLPREAELTFGVQNTLDKNLTNLHTAIHGALVTADFTHTMHTTCFLTSMRIKRGPNASGPFANFTEVIGGEAGSQPAPANVAVLVKKGTALGGHKNAGRWFLPGTPTEAIANGSTYTGAYATATQTIMDNFLAALAANDVPMVLLHSGEAAPQLVTSLSVQTLLSTQRRRLRG